jgi:hypothetical protein
MPWKYARRFFLYDDNEDNFTLAGKVFQRDTDLIIKPDWYIEVRALGAISLCTFSSHLTTDTNIVSYITINYRISTFI